ncbi:GTP-binding nuclear protein Ran-3 [Tanacetum coccineum]|uniref:GTP-binding nuclear protein Ran-3 n=1 Tax=Tanacetum coccineum TaxID=301880 RepID=A0ABQ5J828_9ASTR
MIDVTRMVTLSNVPRMYRDLRRVCGDIPIILCGNKIDMDNKEVHARHLVRFLRQQNLEYIEISALCNYNFENPFLSFIKSLDAGSLQILSEDSDVCFDQLSDFLPSDVEREEELENALVLP